MLGNGQGKRRVKSDGRNNSQLRWRVAILSSGEVTIPAHIASGGRTVHVSHELRLVDVVADGGRYGAFDELHGVATPKEFAQSLVAASRRCFGTAGPIFVEKLMAQPHAFDSAALLVRKFCEQAAQRHGQPPSAQADRVLKRFAIAAVAGELATRFGLTGWTTGEAWNALLALAEECLLRKDTGTRSRLDEAVDRIATWIRGHGAEGLARLTEGGAAGADGWFDEAHYYLRPETWRRIHGGDARDAARCHREADLLRSNEGSNQYRMPRIVPGQPRVYAVLRCHIDGSGGSRSASIH